MTTTNRNTVKLAFRLVLIIGIVNFFADTTYEGARSINGPFLGSFGASAAVVGFVAGLGEMAGYGLRSLTGYFADKTRRYWTFAIIGYAINMLAVPALALAGNWPVAATLMVAERTGRAIRRPAIESMLSRAGQMLGHGWVFGLNEALDQTGATLGPLIIAFVLYRRSGYRQAFAILLVPAVLCLAILVFAAAVYRRPSWSGESPAPQSRNEEQSKAYWLYLSAGTLIAAGFADFSLIAFHFQKTVSVSQDIIPLYYAIAMACSAIWSLVLGKLLDRFPLPVLLVAFGIPAFFAPLVFLGTAGTELAGMILWGMGLGAQDSCLKAALSGIVPSTKRSIAFGVFDTGFGIAWFVGSALMGLLYEKSIPTLVGFSVALQLLALPLLVAATKKASGIKLA